MRKLDPDIASDAAPEGADAIEKLFALAYVLSARLAAIEDSNRELRARAGLDPAPPALGAGWRTMKQAAGQTGYSEAQIRKWIKAGKINAVKIGGRVLIEAATLPVRRVRNNA